MTTVPVTYYGAKRRLLRKAQEMQQAGAHRWYEFSTSINTTLDALGYEAAPALDDKGKPLKVWAVGLYYVLPDEPFGSWEVGPKTRGVRESADWTGYVVASTKTAAIDAIYGPDRTLFNRPKTGEVGAVDVTDLGYEAATRAPVGYFAVKRDETTFHVFPLTSLCRKD